VRESALSHFRSRKIGSLTMMWLRRLNTGNLAGLLWLLLLLLNMALLVQVLLVSLLTNVRVRVRMVELGSTLTRSKIGRS
jgi:hypothetical protein